MYFWIGIRYLRLFSKRHFYLFCGVSIFLFFCVSKNLNNGLSERWHFFLEIGHIGYQNIETFMLISIKQTCLSDKMPPKKLKLKNHFLILLSPIFFVFNFYIFWEQFVNKTSLHFWNQHIILDFLIPNMTYFKEKIEPLRRAIFQIFRQKNQKKIEKPQNKENCLF